MHITFLSWPSPGSAVPAWTWSVDSALLKPFFSIGFLVLVYERGRQKRSAMIGLSDFAYRLPCLDVMNLRSGAQSASRIPHDGRADPPEAPLMLGREIDLPCATAENPTRTRTARAQSCPGPSMMQVMQRASKPRGSGMSSTGLAGHTSSSARCDSGRLLPSPRPSQQHHHRSALSKGQMIPRSWGNTRRTPSRLCDTSPITLRSSLTELATSSAGGPMIQHPARVGHTRAWLHALGCLASGCLGLLAHARAVRRPESKTRLDGTHATAANLVHPDPRMLNGMGG